MVKATCPLCGTEREAFSCWGMTVIGCPCMEAHRYSLGAGVIIPASLFDLPQRLIEDHDPGDEHDANPIRENRAALARERCGA